MTRELYQRFQKSATVFWVKNQRHPELVSGFRQNMRQKVLWQLFFCVKPHVIPAKAGIQPLVRQTVLWQVFLCGKCLPYSAVLISQYLSLLPFFSVAVYFSTLLKISGVSERISSRSLTKLSIFTLLSR